MTTQNTRDVTDAFVASRRQYIAARRAIVAQLATEVGVEARDCTFFLEGYVHPPTLDALDSAGVLERMRAVDTFEERVRPLHALSGHMAGPAEQYGRLRGLSLQESRRELHEQYMQVAGIADALPDVTPAEQARADAIAQRHVWLYRLGQRIVGDT
jgi:hypothetical protein